jgi:hypothetical protein
MRVLMTNNALARRGGSESYLETVSYELRRLGHEVSFFSPTCGETARSLRDHGFEVFDEVADLPSRVDVIHGQHANAVGMVRTRFPAVPLVFATHSWFISPVEDPAPELGASAFLAFNELTRRRLEAHVATDGKIVHRLTQPVDISFADGARVPVGSTARRALAVSRRMSLLPTRLAKLCADRGIEFDWVGGAGRESTTVRQEMFRADIVVAMGRTALEAMAAGRAVLVADETTAGGWVDWSSYERLEADGFTGLTEVGHAAGLETILDGYCQELGSTARALAVQGHSAQQHAVRLVEIYSSVADTVAEAHRTDVLAMLADERFSLEQRAVGAEWRVAQVRRDLDRVQDALDDVRRTRDRLATRLDRVRSRNKVLRGQRDRLRTRRDVLRAKHDEAREELARLEGLVVVRLGRRVKSLLRRVADTFR